MNILVKPPNVWHTQKQKQGGQEGELDQFPNVCYKRIRRIVDRIDVHTEGSAGHDIHTVGSEYAAENRFKLNVGNTNSMHLE